MDKFDEVNIVPWEANIIKLDTGINMAYYVCGPEDGTPLLLLHGVTDGMVSWLQVAPILCDKGYRCYILEYRGNGKTDKPDNSPYGYTAELIGDDVLNFTQKLGLSKVHIVGHSFGSLIAQVLAVKEPEKVDSCVLIDTAVDCRENPVLKWVLEGDNDGFKGVYGYDEAMPEDFLKDWIAMGNEDESFKAAAYQHISQMPMVAWQNLMKGLVRFNSRDFIGKIKAPLLVIWGTADDIFPEKDQAEVKECLVGCNVKYVDVEGASHNGYWDSLEMARTYGDIIDEFVGGL